jgi:hypothetical protein
VLRVHFGPVHRIDDDVALVVRYARRPAALTQSYCSADISTNARRPWRVISIGPQRAYRRNASNSRRNFKIVVMAMAIVRYFDRLHSTPNAADVAAAGNCWTRSLPSWLDSQNERLWNEDTSSRAPDWCEVIDLGGNLLREDAPEADDLIVPQIGCLARTAQEECADRLSQPRRAPRYLG